MRRTETRFGKSWMAVVALTTMSIAGCFGSPDSDAADGPFLLVVDDQGQPVPWAAATLLRGDIPVLATSAAAAGRLTFESPEGVTALVVGHPGFEPQRLEPVPTRGPITLAPASSSAAAPLLRFTPAVLLQCPRNQPGQDPNGILYDVVDRGNCGRAAEPVIEAAGDGSIWISAAAGVGNPSPIWVSRDKGATFKLLRPDGTGIHRHLMGGAEGDFAFDDAGNAYFFDMGSSSGILSSYTVGGKHRWTSRLNFQTETGVVDRPWVRAGKENQVFFLFNNYGPTAFFRSNDGGLSLDPTVYKSFPCPLMSIGQGPARDRLLAAGCYYFEKHQHPSLWISSDAGTTWSAPERLPLPPGDYPPIPDDRGGRPDDGRRIDQYMPPVADEDGTIYIPYSHALPGNTTEVALYVVRRNPDASWDGPFRVSAPGTVRKVWPAVGAAGQLAIAYYHRPLGEDKWYVSAALSLDARAPEPHFQLARVDPAPVIDSQGWGLGDFLQADVTPEGRFILGFARRTEEMSGADSYFVQSDGGIQMAPKDFPNGP